MQFQIQISGRFAATLRLAPVVAFSLALVACASSGAPPENPKPAGKLSDVFATPDWAKFTGPDRKTGARAVTPDDLIGADGACAATRIAAPELPVPPVAETDGANETPAAAPIVPMQPGPMMQPGPTISGGIALAMTECDVAQRAGYPGRVDINAEADGARNVVLTYMQGPWPGIYRFREGRLVSIERVVVPEPPKVKAPVRRGKPTKVNLRRTQ